MEENKVPVQEADSQTEKASPLSKISKKGWAAIGAVAVLAAIAVGIFAGGGMKATTMSLLKTQGTVDIANEAGKSVAPKENLKLYSGYRVDTKLVSYAWIDLDRVKVAKLDEESGVEIRKDGKDLELLVQSGSLFFNVKEPLADDESMTIRTSTMAVGIRGTCGWVADGSQGSQVYIMEGRVEAEALDTGETVEVSAGEMAEVTVSAEGRTEITVQPFAEEYVPAFVLAELEEDGDLSAAVLEASGLDVLNPSDPAERLMEEYQQIIAEQQLFDGFNPGVCYANYVDVDNDEIPELLLLSLTASEENGQFYGWGCSLELYGTRFGYAEKYELGPVDGIAPSDEFSARKIISLAQSEGRTYLHASYMDGQNGFDDFYLIDRSSVSKAAELSTVHVSAYETGLTNFGQEITADEFNELWHKYADNEVTILSNTASLLDPVADWGVLTKPQPSAEVQRRLAILEALESGNARYAKLIDLNEDGIEDLLTVQRVSRPNPDAYTSSSFVAYCWEESSLQAHHLTQYDPLFSDQYMSWEAEGIYREKSTGKIYVRYLLEDPLYPSAYVFESLSDYCEYQYYMGREGYLDGLQYFPETEEEWAEVYAMADQSERERQAVETEIANRFDLVEAITGEMNQDMINQVRQQLMSR